MGGSELQEREFNGQTHWVPVVTSKSGLFKPDTFVRANVVGDAVQHSGLRGLEVVGLRTHILPKNAGFLPMYTPGHSNEDGLYGEYGSRNPIYLSTSTGEYYMVHPKTGHIIASSPDENVLRDASLWTPYHTGLYGDYKQSTLSFLNNVGAENVAEAQRADENRRTNAPLHMEYDPATGRTYWMGLLTLNQFNVGQRNAVNNFASGVGNMTAAGFNVANQAITGLGRVAVSAVNDGDYGWNNYLEGFGVKRNADGRYELTGFNNNSSVGLGDLVYEANHDVNPYVRTALNFVNPESIAGTVSSIQNRGIVREGTHASSQPIYGDAVDIKTVRLTNGFRTPKVTTVDRSGPHTLYTGTVEAPVVSPTPGGRVTGSTFRYGNGSWEGMGTTTNNNGIWTNGGSRTQYGWLVRPISSPGKAAPTTTASVLWQPVVGWTYTPGTEAVKSAVTPTVINAKELGYDYRDFGTEVAPSPYVVQYDPQVSTDPAWNYKILDAEYVPVDLSAGNDVMTSGDVQVEGSNGKRNDVRSQGRRSRSRLIKRNRQSTGKTDRTT